MSIGRLILAPIAIGVPIGLLAGFERWPHASIQLAIAITTVIAVPTLLALPDTLHARRRRR